MDEILASIRRIISDDDTPARREAATPAKDVPPRRGLGDDTRFAPTARPEPPRRGESAGRPEASRPDAARQDMSRQEPARHEPTRADAYRQDARAENSRQDAYGAENARPMAARPQPPRETVAAHESAARDSLDRDPFAEPVSLGLDRYDDPASGWDETGGAASMPYREDEDMADYPASGVAPRAPVSQPAQPAPARADGVTRPTAARAADGAARPFGDAPRRKDLLSPAVDAAVAAAFESLGDMVLPTHERTVEDLVKEILRPMLKEWLDANLPDIVERLVRAEIERVSRTAR
ncbi:DUF2497 domain-containing protein [Roseixanthobacter pseudopolyaromaticivorans]|uniref:DUF2497 domain-containing protein n=1 Tax=Xanthobacteraceae TaxID=335928 RepID=UPI00372C45E2